ncbi:hypothetical protein [Legionella clemsonensis]|uniref:Uncharacterized protein n=1 Tax=Legionella clemsonensis TaxID=1867846 RepID=A0A222P052_9GAMM|nr:hypothetical protein [Legionella clemsonensis]ASQ45227.1 hypothetical protein clem_03345 [Legionella clemsonensis]
MFRLLAKNNTNIPTSKIKRESQITFKFLDLQLRLSNAYLAIIKASQDAFYLKSLLKKYQILSSEFYSTNPKINKEYQAINVEIFLNSPWKNYVYENIESQGNIVDKTAINREVFTKQANAVEAVLAELKKIQERYDALKPEIFAEDNAEFVEKLLNTITLANKLIDVFKGEKIKSYKKIIDLIIKKASFKSDNNKIIRKKPLSTPKARAASAKIRKIEFDKIISRLIYASRDIASPIINFLNQDIAHDKLEQQFTRFMSIIIEIDKLQCMNKNDEFLENLKNFTAELNEFLAVINKGKSSDPKINLTQNLIIQMISLQLNPLLPLNNMKPSFTSEQSAHKIITEFKKTVIRINKNSLNEEEIQLIVSIFNKFQSSLFYYGELATHFFQNLNKLGDNILAELRKLKTTSKNTEIHKVLDEVEMIVGGLKRNAMLIELGAYARYQQAALIQSYILIESQKRTIKILGATTSDFTNYFTYLTLFLNEVLLKNSLVSIDVLTDLQILYDMSMKPATLIQQAEVRKKYYALVTTPLLKLIFEMAIIGKFTRQNLNESSIEVEEGSTSYFSPSDYSLSEVSTFKEESTTDQEIKELTKKEKSREKLSNNEFSSLNLLIPELTFNTSTTPDLIEKNAREILDAMPQSDFTIARPSRLNSVKVFELFGRRGTISEETSSTGSPRTLSDIPSAETPRAISRSLSSRNNFFFKTEQRKHSENEPSNNQPESHF